MRIIPAPKADISTSLLAERNIRYNGPKACVLPPNLFKLPRGPFLIETRTRKLPSYGKKPPLEQLYLTLGESEAGCEYWGHDKLITFMPGGIRMTFNVSAGVQASR